MEKQLISVDESNKNYLTGLIPTDVIDLTDKSNKYFAVLSGRNRVGVCAVKTIDNRCFLEYIYIIRKYRRKGYATWILEELKKQFDGEIITSYNSDNKELSSFFDDSKAEEIDSYILYRYMMRDVLNNDNNMMKIQGRVDLSGIRYLDGLTAEEKYEVLSFLKDNNEIESYFPQNPESQKYSCIFKDKAIEGFLVCTYIEDTISIDMIYSVGKSEKILLAMLSAILKKVISEKDDIKYLRMLAVNEKIATLAQYLIGEGKAEESKTKIVVLS